MHTLEEGKGVSLSVGPRCELFSCFCFRVMFPGVELNFGLLCFFWLLALNQQPVGSGLGVEGMEFVFHVILK